MAALKPLVTRSAASCQPRNSSTAAEDHRTGIDAVEASVFGGGAVGGLEDGVLADVGAGAMPRPPTMAAAASEM